MKVALVGFWGCLKMRTVLISRRTPKRQTTAMLHASALASESSAWVKRMHSATKHATAE